MEEEIDKKKTRRKRPREERESKKTMNIKKTTQHTSD